MRPHVRQEPITSAVLSTVPLRMLPNVVPGGQGAVCFRDVPAILFNARHPLPTGERQGSVELPCSAHASIGVSLCDVSRRNAPGTLLRQGTMCRSSTTFSKQIRGENTDQNDNDYYTCNTSHRLSLFYKKKITLNNEIYGNGKNVEESKEKRKKTKGLKRNE